MSTTRPGFVRGGLAFLDVLGFRGIWQRNTDPQRILDRLADLEPRSTHGGAIIDELNAAGWPAYERRVQFVSDSVFVGVWPRDDIPTTDTRGPLQNCVAHLGTLCRAIAYEGLADPDLPFRFRGVVSCGDFLMHPAKGFLVGPAVDEVAGLEREAEGAFIWLAPSALDVLDDCSVFGPSFSVPMKGGLRLETGVLNAVFAPDAPDRAERLATLISAEGSGSLSVRAKVQHIRSFYESVEPELFEEASAILAKRKR